MCITCCEDSCDGCEGVAEAQGDPGEPAFLNLNFIQAGAPFTDSSNNWVEAGRFLFSKDVADLFTSVRVNIWRTGGASVNFRLKDLVSGTVINTWSVTSASAINIEVKKSLQVYNSSSAIIAVEVQSVGGNDVNIGSAMFAYEE